MKILSWMFLFEGVYFFILLLLGFFLGQWVKRRLVRRAGHPPSSRDERMYVLFAFLFLLVSLFYLLFGHIPGWIGRNISFFAGYYGGMAWKIKQK